jgi:chromosome segregation ATPase
MAATSSCMQSKSQAEREVATLTEERNGLLLQLDEFKANHVVFVNAKAELADITTKYEASQKQLQHALGCVMEQRNSLEANAAETRDVQARLNALIEVRTRRVARGVTTLGFHVTTSQKLTNEVAFLKSQLEIKEQQLVNNSAAYEDKLALEVQNASNSYISFSSVQPQAVIYIGVLFLQTDMVKDSLQQMQLSMEQAVASLEATVAGKNDQIGLLEALLQDLTAKHDSLEINFAAIIESNKQMERSMEHMQAEHAIASKETAAKEGAVQAQLMDASAEISRFRSQLYTLQTSTKQQLKQYVTSNLRRIYFRAQVLKITFMHAERPTLLLYKAHS